MKQSCAAFRGRLEEALRGYPAHGVPPELAWHGHLLGCTACRRLLAAEEVLETLLATLPDPRLPPDLAARVLAALVAGRAPEGVDALDRLLDLDRADEAPVGLAGRVRRGLSTALEDERLERLLERVPPPSVPDGLSGRVLAGLAARRRPAAVRRGLLRGRLGRAAAAAAILAGLALGIARLRRADPGSALRTLRDDVGVELLSSLAVLENWELLTSTDLEVLLAQLDAFDEELLLLEADGAVDPAPPPEDEKHG